MPKKQTVEIPVSDYEPARAVLVKLSDLKASDWNPKIIQKTKFRNLCVTLAKDPKFLWNKPLMAQGDMTLYVGHQRREALIELWLHGCPDNKFDWQVNAAAAGILPGTAPAIIEDCDDTLARERGIIDNREWGEWQEEQLAEVLFGLEQAGSDITLLGFDEKEMATLFDVPEGDDTENFGDFDSSAVAPGFVQFKIGKFSGQVSNAVYDSFEKLYRDKQKATDGATMDDVLKVWLDV